MKQILFTPQPVDKIIADLAIVPIFEDVRPLGGVAGLVDWRMNGQLSEFLLEHRFTGEFEEALLMPTRGRIKAKQLILLGVGTREAFTDYLLPAVYRRLLNLVANKGETTFSFCLSDLIQEKFEWRNAVRKFVSKLFDYDCDFQVTLSEDRTLIQEARRRHMDFGLPIRTYYDIDGEVIAA